MSARKSTPIEDDDPVESMLRKSGCLDLHHLVQDCVFEKKDWRQCQVELHKFKSCMDKYEDKKRIERESM